jgi:hypothetical protein
MSDVTLARWGGVCKGLVDGVGGILRVETDIDDINRASLKVNALQDSHDRHHEIPLSTNI